MNIISIGFLIIVAYIGTHVVLLPVRFVKQIRKQPASISYTIFVPIFLIIFAGCFLYSSRDINFGYFPWGQIASGMLILLVITGVGAYLLTLIFRIIRKLSGQGMKLSVSAYEAAFFLVLLVIIVISVPMNPETPRMMMSEALSLGTAYKIPVAEYYTDNHQYPGNAELKTFGPPLKGKYVQDISIDNNGRIVVTMKKNMYKSISGKSLIFIPHDGGKTWDCSGPEIPNKYLPGSCRRH